MSQNQAPAAAKSVKAAIYKSHYPNRVEMTLESLISIMVTFISLLTQIPYSKAASKG